MSAAQEIADLDEALALDGEDIELHRPIAGQGPVKVTCRAFVRGASVVQLSSGVKQDASNVVLSPSEIIRRGWPGPNSSATPTAQDRRVPRTTDKVLIAGRTRQIDAVMPVYVDGALVRIDMRVLG